MFVCVLGRGGGVEDGKVGSATEVKGDCQAQAEKDSYSQIGDVSQIIHWRLDKEGIFSRLLRICSLGRRSSSPC